MRAPHQELVDDHGGIDGDFAAEVVRNGVLRDGAGRVLLQQLGEALDTHVQVLREGRDTNRRA